MRILLSSTASCRNSSRCALLHIQRLSLSSRPWLQALRHNSSGTTPKEIKIEGRTYKTDEWANTPASILDAVPRKLHLQPDHPLTITRKLIESRFPGYKTHNDLFPIVTTAQNFDSLGFPLDHVGRSRTDTYYINKETVLRTHTSAHQADTFRNNESEGYLISADVYRRDAIDRSHYPVFHQMEGARTWDRPPSRKEMEKSVGRGDPEKMWKEATKSTDIRRLRTPKSRRIILETPIHLQS
ncbi:hypothetical protein SNOG_07527 [Parastagonospora nodorum SN15]|uniref:Phenylalanyl-tRNA synthetase domain-containing protein n=1 Tax=Phaeosphaeria nodorum (strain SN15 / ATCC MYA-4574 / FGSC 10173) TaxID=321614 RepID=Q0UL37_PHANO|nr:hypothetical protein SNOG_07527 [Parastagonospora nodorum SN15]EAT84993.1 hypothetical protein SNOG_07527 [Parastagonospora nodorum SN15]